MDSIKRNRQPVLEVSSLRIERDGVVILDGIDWRIEKGEHWVLIGANGSGKTTLLSALTGYFMPTGGEMDLLGRRYGESDWRELRKLVGLVSSSIRQMMAETESAVESVVGGKYAMIDYWGKVSRTDRARAMRILEQVECGYLAERAWQHLSQGEKQRVLIGRALMGNPKLLILDEPCAGLDPAAREHFLQFLQRLGTSRSAPTLVLVTHHVEEIAPVFSHLLMLREGRVLSSGRKMNLMNSKLFSQAFSSSVRVKRVGQRYQLAVAAKRNVVI